MYFVSCLFVGVIRIVIILWGAFFRDGLVWGFFIVILRGFGDGFCSRCCISLGGGMDCLRDLVDFICFHVSVSFLVRLF
jgi:hypothetical protein